MVASIQPETLAARLRDEPVNVDLVDVRTPGEFRAVHVEGARSIPLNEVDADAVHRTRPTGATGPTLLICKAGQRAAKAAERLERAGAEVAVVEGGTDACVAAGLSVQRGRAVMSLERQVRIAAGSLVFLGVVLAAALSPWWLVLPGFVGAGLVFAGVTDTCGMGLLLAKLPWNR